MAEESANGSSKFSKAVRKGYGERVQGGTNGSTQTVWDIDAMGDIPITEEAIIAERVSLLAERQTQLDKILDIHDSLVRELFHLEKFVTLLSYDPTVAKRDNSAVFTEYKAGYDLLQKDPASTSVSRTTRRAHTQRLQALTGPLADPSLSKSGFIGSGKRGDPIDTTADTEIFWSILAEAKGKEKVSAPSSVGDQAGKHSKRRTRKLSSDHVSLPSIRVASRDPGNILVDDGGVAPSISAGPMRKRTNISLESKHPPSPSPLKKRRVAESHEMPTRSTVSGPARHLHHVRSESRLTLEREGMSHRPNGVTVQRKSKRHSSSHMEASASHFSLRNGSPDLAGPPTFNVKRIKLIVRPPLPSYSNPRQRPPPPKFGSSLLTYLQSYVTLNDQDYSETALRELARKDAAFLNRLDTLHKEGRIIVDSEIFSDLASARSTPSRDLKASTDVWSHVVRAATAKARGGRVNGRQVAAQVANRVRAYWDNFAVREDKAKVQEEKRLRALAKATIKMVTNEWKKAVFYIREQERLKMEAEEMRRGHEHLDAILDQSGQILETQQVDLKRADSRPHSRSSSVSATFHDEESDEDEEGSEIESGDGEEDELSAERSQSDDDEENDSEEDQGTSALALLGGGLLFEPVEQDTESSANFLASDLDQAAVQDQDETPEPSEQNLDTESVPVQMFDPFDRHEPSEAKMFGSPLICSKSSESPSALFDFHSPPQLAQFSQASASDSEFAPQIMDEASVPLQLSPKSALGDVTTADIVPMLQQSDGDLQLTLPDESQISRAEIVTAPISSASDSPAVAHATSDAFFPDDAALGVSSPVAADSNIDDALVSTPPAEDANASFSQDVDEEDEEDEISNLIPDYLKPFAVAPVEWNPDDKVKPPALLRGILRPYQQSGLEWLASLHINNLNGILADEMGLGKTIQTIALLAHLACDRGIWGPHLIIVPTSVLLNWEMEFKKFLPGFRILSYHGHSKRRKELRQGWYNKHHFNVCVTSYTLASRDAHIFKRKAWYYMILDEAHMIKNFKSQRWNILLMFRSFRRLLLTGTPLQNNLTELWALLQFLMSGTNFANLKEFGEWFSNPLEKAIEMGTMLDDENLQRVTKLHTVLRPYLLRRLKKDVEKELPSKYEHLVLCPLSKRQRFLYDEFMERAHTRDALQSGVYQQIANILMQLRKVCNHPDLFEVRPVVTSFAMERSAVADFEIRELLVRRQLLKERDENIVNLDLLGLRFADRQNTSVFSSLETKFLDATSRLPFISEMPGEPPPKDFRTIQGYREYRGWQQHADTIAQWAHIGYLNRLRCNRLPIYSQEMLTTVRKCYRPLRPHTALDLRREFMDTSSLIHSAVKSYATRAEDLAVSIDKFAFATPAVVAADLPRLVLKGYENQLDMVRYDLGFDSVIHQASVKLQIQFPDPSLLQYDCGKLQELARLLRERKAGGHRVLIFTQMTRILDILEIFLNLHGYLYLRLDGATKIEDRQYITERFNADARIFCFISSSRSGGVGINLTGADTVVFYDSDFNPQMDKQCEDRAHRIGQIRDVHIYRFISAHTVEEAMLLKANQKRSLDDIVIQKGEFDWRSLFKDEAALTNALGQFEDREDAHAAAVAAREEDVLEGADQADFGAEGDAENVEVPTPNPAELGDSGALPAHGSTELEDGDDALGNEDVEEEGGTVADYMISFVRNDSEFFRDWRL